MGEVGSGAGLGVLWVLSSPVGINVCPVSAHTCHVGCAHVSLAYAHISCGYVHMPHIAYVCPLGLYMCVLMVCMCSVGFVGHAMSCGYTCMPCGVCTHVVWLHIYVLWTHSCRHSCRSDQEGWAHACPGPTTPCSVMRPNMRFSSHDFKDHFSESFRGDPLPMPSQSCPPHRAYRFPFTQWSQDTGYPHWDCRRGAKQHPVQPSLLLSCQEVHE